jgi:hypothetical protein
MSGLDPRTNPELVARRLYELIPGHYRAYDEEEPAPPPLQELIRVVGASVAYLRQDLDALLDNLSIETAEDWVVPYLAALVGTRLLPRADARSTRLDVRNTVAWRRRKGTPAVAREVAQAMGGWPTERIAEFFAQLGWSQNLNHLRLQHPLTPDLRDPVRIDRLGHADDPFAHAADFHPIRALDGPRVTPGSLGIGRVGWGTPGRYQIKQVGVFVHRLKPFRLSGVVPAAADPGLPAPPAAGCFTFDPLHREAPLFIEQTAAPLTRTALDASPWETFGRDLAVRQHGLLLASESPPAAPDRVGAVAPRSWDLTAAPAGRPADPRLPFTFGGQGAGLTLDTPSGLRLLTPRDFRHGGAHFVVVAEWWDGAAASRLGAMSTLWAASGATGAYQGGVAAEGNGQLRLTVHTARAGLGFAGLPPSPAGRFPGAAMAIRRANPEVPRSWDAILVALPAASVTPTEPRVFYVADDGALYTDPGLTPASLVAPAGGSVHPRRVLTARVRPPSGYVPLHRGPGGMWLPDQSRFGGAQVLVQAEVFAPGANTPLGAVATMDRVITDHPELEGPNAWPAFTYRRSLLALAGNLPEGKLALRVRPLSGNLLPAFEAIVVDRTGRSLLIQVPEATSVPSTGVELLVGDDGSTWFAPADPAARLQVATGPSLEGLTLARPSAGQVVAIPGVLPLQQRTAVGLDLCDCRRRQLLLPGELGIDPERGRFALAPEDPAEGGADLTVDYVEAFTGRIGARPFPGRIDHAVAPTRLVASSGDAISRQTTAALPVQADLAAAIAAAGPNEVIEIADSATYLAPATLTLPAGVRTVTLRAAEGERPCLAFYDAAGDPTAIGLHVAHPLDRVELSGLLISGGPVRIENEAKEVVVTACTLDPLIAKLDGGMLIVADDDTQHAATYLCCRCIIGGIRAGQGIARLTVADSIVDLQDRPAIAGLQPTDPARTVHLERVTVFGSMRCVELHASECLFDDLVTVEDRQVGCVRFSRCERGSILPRRYACVPTKDAADACPPDRRCMAPMFDARRFTRPDYARLAQASPPEITVASEAGSEVGAFASDHATIRLENLVLKLREYLPVSLTAAVVAET